MSVKFRPLLILLVLFLIGCSAAAPAADTPAEVGESNEEQVSEQALQPVTRAPETEEGQTTETISEEAVSENDAATSGLVEEVATDDAAVSEVVTEESIATESELAVSEPLPTDGDQAGAGGLATDSMMIEPIDPLANTELILAVDLPSEPTSATVWSQPAFYGSLENATAWLNRFRFQGPLYQEFLDPGIRDQYDSLGEGVWRAPFYAFNGNERLTISAGGVFYENRGVEDDFPTTITFEETRPLAEAQIAEWGGLNFEYALLEDGMGNVVVKRLIDGRLVDYVEAYFHYNNSGQLVYASYNILDQLQPQDALNIKSAAEAWALLQEGEVDYDQITYYIDYGFETFPTEPDFFVGEFLSWFRTYNPGETATIYGYPFMLLPVQDDSLPYVQAGEYLVLAGPEELFALGTANTGQIRFQGQIDESGENLILSTWEPLDDNFGLPFEGVLTRDGDNGRLEAIDGNTYTVPQLPADFPDSLDVYIYGYMAEQNDAPNPVIDWLNIDQKLDDASLAADDRAILPVEPGFEEEPINSITFDSIELGYTFAPEWDEESLEIPDYDVPPTDLVPTWIFTGTTDSGQRIVFSVRATLD